jgi:phosphoribosylformylglycinamidine synthase
LVKAANKYSPFLETVQKICFEQSILDNDIYLIVLPCGFSYGDYLRSGAMAKISPIMQEIKRLAARGVNIFGICNGFQILTEAGLLPGALLRNKKMKFACREVFLRVEKCDNQFTAKYKNGQTINLPIAHADGNYFADTTTLKKLEDCGNIVFRYVDENDKVTDDSNPNGSALNIAGIINDQKNILGMMPHPERAIDQNTGSTDGLNMFLSFA